MQNHGRRCSQHQQPVQPAGTRTPAAPPRFWSRTFPAQSPSVCTPFAYLRPAGLRPAGVEPARGTTRRTSNPHPPRTMVDGEPLGQAASGELARLQIRVVLVPMLRECRTGDPCSKSGLSAHVKPSARAHQTEGAEGISPPAASAAVGLPGCRRAGGQSMKHPLSILQRGRLSRPCLRRSLSAAVFRGRHRIRHQSCKPELGAPGSNRPAACCGTP